MGTHQGVCRTRSGKGQLKLVLQVPAVDFGDARLHLYKSMSDGAQIADLSLPVALCEPVTDMQRRGDFLEYVELLHEVGSLASLYAFNQASEHCFLLCMLLCERPGSLLEVLQA